MKIIGIIQARERAKGVLVKKIKLLIRKPLLSYRIEHALASNLLSRVMLTIDHQGIMDLGNFLGLEVPFLRTS